MTIFRVAIRYQSLRRSFGCTAMVFLSGCALEPSSSSELDDPVPQTSTEARPDGDVAQLGQPISLCGPEIVLPDAPTPDGLHTGYVEFESSHPFLDGLSIKPEHSNELDPALPGRHLADGIYSLNWGSKTAFKVGGLCVAHVKADQSVSCCCSVAGAIAAKWKGGCQFVSPGSGDEYAWPTEPLGTPTGSEPLGTRLSSSWSASMPNLGDGTYKCGNTHSDAVGRSSVQDCTRAVKGGSWQTVSIYTNRHKYTADVRMATSAVRDGTYVSTVTCTGVIPNNASRACWGKTYQSPKGTIQTLNRGGRVGVYSANGGVIVIPRAFSPSRSIVP